MKLLSTNIHSVMDYIVGGLLVVCPLLFSINSNSAGGITLYAAGGTLLLHNIITKYEAGIFRILPLRIHLLLEVIIGIFLAASPWLLNFSGTVFLPHLLFGLLAIGNGVMRRAETP
ncbi:SPW repeat domain-containing protein [Flavobacterium limi]|uniref:SPW repeat domain-containing protein n=1 Tax=Flavobacterium limi TaxID=2045105 RepID=UPI0035713B3B